MSVTDEEVARLRAGLKAAIERSESREWFAALPERKRAEVEFHDPKREIELPGAHGHHELDEKYSNRRFYETAVASRRHLDLWIAKNAPGKIVLDYACGNAVKSIEAAKAGAKLVIGLDISPAAIENARRLAKEAGVEDRTLFLVGDCEDTLFPSESIDAILCLGMLHHLDLSYAFPEMRRILKPGGVAFGFEALHYNPVFTLYRRMTPHLRTDWEKHHILRLRDLRFAKRFFEVRNVRYWNLASLAATPLRRSGAFQPVLRAGIAADKLLLRIPGIQQMAWMFTFELVRPAKA